MPGAPSWLRIMYMLAWLSVAITLSPAPAWRRLQYMASSSARVMVLVAPRPQGSTLSCSGGSALYIPLPVLQAAVPSLLVLPVALPSVYMMLWASGHAGAVTLQSAKGTRSWYRRQGRRPACSSLSLFLNAEGVLNSSQAQGSVHLSVLVSLLRSSLRGGHHLWCCAGV